MFQTKNKTDKKLEFLKAHILFGFLFLEISTGYKKHKQLSTSKRLSTQTLQFPKRVDMNCEDYYSHNCLQFQQKST